MPYEHARASNPGASQDETSATPETQTDSDTPDSTVSVKPVSIKMHKEKTVVMSTNSQPSSTHADDEYQTLTTPDTTLSAPDTTAEQTVTPSVDAPSSTVTEEQTVVAPTPDSDEQTVVAPTPAQPVSATPHSDEPTALIAPQSDSENADEDKTVVQSAHVQQPPAAQPEATSPAVASQPDVTPLAAADASTEQTVTPVAPTHVSAEQTVTPYTPVPAPPSGPYNSSTAPQAHAPYAAYNTPQPYAQPSGEFVPPQAPYAYQPYPGAQNVTAPHAYSNTAPYPYPNPAFASQAPTPPMSEPTGIAKPLPRWAFLGGIALLVLAIAGLFFTGKDWAAGVLNGALLAIVVAVALVIALGVRSLLGLAARTNPHRRMQIISTLLIVLVLSVYSGLGLIFQPALHTAQAGVLRSQGQWDNAITQYEFGGDKAPASSNIAATYVDWGRDLIKQKEFADANEKFDTVLNDYTEAKEQQKLAQKGKVENYLAWGKSFSGRQQYGEAFKQFETAFKLPYCDSTCKKNASNLAAQAKYDSALVQLNDKKYEAAVDDFRIIQNSFVSTTAASKIHPDFGKALLGLGKEQRKVDCDTALPTYTELARSFIDLPEGKEAKKEMDAPQIMKGRLSLDEDFKQYETAIVLFQNVNKNTDPQTLVEIGSKSPTAIVNNDTGQYAFKPLKQDTYIVGYRVSGNGVVIYEVPLKSSGQPWTITVGPLCPIVYDI